MENKKPESVTDALIAIIEEALKDETKVEIGKIVHTAMGLIVTMDKETTAFDMLKKKLTVMEYDRFMSNLSQSLIVTLYSTRFDSPDDPDFVRMRNRLSEAVGAKLSEFMKDVPGGAKA